MPVLHYGSENWILTENLLDRLEAFQAKLVKRALKCPKYLSNTAAVTVLDVPSMRCRILERKLAFLHRVMSGRSSQLSCLVKEIFCDRISSLCLVKACRELEETMKTSFAEAILTGEDVGREEWKKCYREVDKQKMLDRCEKKSPGIVKLAREIGLYWPETVGFLP